MKKCSIVFLFILPQLMCAQGLSNLNYFVGAGLGYIFNDPSLTKGLGQNFMTGVNYEVTRKKRNLIFNPGIYIQVNDYYTRMHRQSRIQTRQHTGSAHLDVLMMLNKKCYLKVGLFYNRVIYSSVEILSRDYNGISYSGSSELYEKYSVAVNQTGFTVGVSFPFRLYRRNVKLGLSYQYIASRVVNSDYFLTRAQVGEDVSVLSVKARPSILILGFEFSFRRLKKKETPEED